MMKVGFIAGFGFALGAVGMFLFVTDHQISKIKPAPPTPARPYYFVAYQWSTNSGQWFNGSMLVVPSLTNTVEMHDFNEVSAIVRTHTGTTNVAITAFTPLVPRK
jgi:hypothetical protein